MAWETEAAEMVERLGPLPPAIARAMRRIPRHAFVPEARRGSAYDDTPIELPHGNATISAPHMVALQLEMAELSPGLRILEVGAGFGYLCALLAELVGATGAVYGLDIEPALIREARRRLGQVGLGDRVQLKVEDGRAGWPERAPFDRILVSCATPEIYDTWVGQLSPQGLLVAPLGGGFGQELVRYRAGTPRGTLERGPRCLFVPLRGRLPSDI